ncbi:DNA-repair protein XRCC2 [Cladophialophora carrionii]|uniref:DNA-repair protein XRCC2 n=1 Tax=Cladophialophora carrionii TaxID=86049 RepID=A0A1C1CWF7_9EURO|nr:DNA-repair protein XRCC2 [Cladophialophora carrionii]
MAAEHYGARLLEDVQEESLEKFLADLRHITCPRPRAVFGVPQLDKLLEAVRYPAEKTTTPQRPAWQSPEHHDSEGEGQQDTDISLHGRYVEAAAVPSKAQARVKPKPATIELTSQTSASGKTALLSYLAAVSVLPRHAGGKESVVVYIDADGRLSARRLKQIMYHYICEQRQQQQQKSNQQFNNPGNNTSLSPSIPAEAKVSLDLDVNTTIQEALHHVHVFRPQSSSQVLSILSNLEAYLLDTSGRQSMCTHRPLGLVIIDPATAFYWQDRFDRAMARLETVPGQGTQGQRPSSMTFRIIERLKTLQTRFECAVLFSTTVVSLAHPSGSDAPASVTPAGAGVGAGAGPADDGRSMSPWTGYATLTLALARMPVARFTPKMGMDECVSVRERRFEAVRQGRFTAVVQHMKAVEGGRTAGVAGFRFSITEQGVEVGWIDG